MMRKGEQGKNREEVKWGKNRKETKIIKKQGKNRKGK